MVWWMWRRRGDEGFLVVEAVVALAVLGVLSAAVAQLIYSGYSAQRLGRTVQTATAVANRALEQARAVGYDGLAMSGTDLSSTPDPMLTTACPGLTGTWFYAPGGSTPCEAIVVASGSDPTVNATPFDPGDGLSVRQYVTWVDASAAGGPGEDYKRVTARVTWTEKGHSHTVVDTTLVTPITVATPAYDVTVAPVAVTATAAAGRTAVFTLTVTNVGTAADLFNPSVALPSGTGWSSRIYLDNNGSGSPTTTYGGTNPLLGDSNGDGTVDTGTLDPNASVSLVIAVTTPSSASGSYTVTVTVTSVMAPTKSATATGSITVTSGVTPKVYYLHNTATQPATKTNAQLNMPLDTSLPTGNFVAAKLPDMSMDVAGGIHGRYLTRTSNGAGETSPAAMADWILPVSSYLRLSGNVTVTVWLDGCLNKTTGGTTAVVAYLGAPPAGVDAPTSTNWIGASAVSASATGLDCTGKNAVQVTLTIPVDLTLGATQTLELKLAAPAGVAADAIIGYDGSSAAASVTLPVVAT